MDAGHQSLATLLTLAALIGATIEYVEVVRRREVRRRSSAELALMHESGLRGLVRIFAVTER